MSFFKGKRKKLAPPQLAKDFDSEMKPKAAPTAKNPDSEVGPKAAPKPAIKTRNLQNPKILEVNLIKDEELVRFDWSRNFLFLALVIILAVLLVGEIYFGLDWWAEQEEARLAPLQKKIDNLNAETVKLNNEAQAALSYRDKAVAFGTLLDNHIYWSQFFSWLEKNTLSTVKYKEFGGDISGSYTLKATAPSFSEVSWQASAFLKDPAVSKVSIREAILEGDDEELSAADQVSFDIFLEVNRDIFKK